MTVVASQLSLEVDSVSRIVLNFNMQSIPLLPSWASLINEAEKTFERGFLPPGTKVLQGKSLEVQDILDDLERLGFVPTRLLFINRAQGFKKRVSLVLVKSSESHSVDGRISALEEGYILDVILKRFWDSMIYRNPDDNFVIESGNPICADKHSNKSTADLRVNEETKRFELIS